MADEVCTVDRAAHEGPVDDRAFEVQFSCGRAVTNPVFVSRLTGRRLRVHLVGGPYSTESHEARAWGLEQLASKFGEKALQEHLARLAEGVSEEWSLSHLGRQGTDAD